MCFVEDLLSSGEHMLKTFVIDHTAGFIVAEGPGQNDLEHELGGSAQWLLIRHFAKRGNAKTIAEQDLARGGMKSDLAADKIAVLAVLSSPLTPPPFVYKIGNRQRIPGRFISLFGIKILILV